MTRQIDRIQEQQHWMGLHPRIKRGVMAAKENMTVIDGKAFDQSGRDITHMVDVVVKTTEKQARGLEVVDGLTALEKENGGFVFAFFKQSRTIEERFPSLTQQDIARLMYIGTFVAWKTGRLQSENGKAIIDREKLESLVEMSRRRFNELFRRYEAEGILREDKETGEIFVNPTVFFRGHIKGSGLDVSHLQYTRMFRTTVRDLYAKFKGRTLGQLAIIYSVMPFLNFNTNIVCYNPKETIEEMLRPMPLNKLATLLGYDDPAKLKRALNAVKVDDKPVFTYVTNAHDRRKQNIIINPRVIYAGDGKGLGAITALFN
ncbi:hypothetical protein [Sporosarcina newyorkensis]|uniref:Uncharacterized protein n=1 Tax=Sporosarcina newyorkensis TaxID=759851 RepID=A0A1T4XGV4_9BACL|nr:hypothetical protein [Sporosarcina newyorkensis]SKA88723.1 hypothetical protein SAMN04244570_0730 [Sporosarcina newyorkensis]